MNMAAPQTTPESGGERDPYSRRVPRVHVLVAVVVAAIAAAGCGGDGGAERRAEDRGYPPNDFEALAELFDPQLAPMGLRLARGALIDEADGYVESDTGTHLALYAEPVGEYTTADYLEGLNDLTALLTPQVFERWPELVSYDICQEPPQDQDPRPEPRAYTQVQFNRHQAQTVDWEEFDAVQMLTLSLDPEGPRVIVSGDLRDDPAYLALRQQANERYAALNP